ncbi:hypothetical protein HPB47_003473 [Ixodes persulcatus]|uniref:Uncharacterized protein n=1 Tax=Ixodes persulcatus TaxID=34615 RepID=A0AC60PIH0_IXOPE|nr:hypothetical protein HPB47_003473 [Ixodes persulcatus]
MASEIEVATSMGDNMTSTLNIGSFGGRTYIEVHGEDIKPEEAEGWSASGKRIKQIMAGKENGESAAISRQSRPKTRASFAKRVAASVTKAARMPIDMSKEDTKVVMRPRGGLNVGRTEVSIIMSVVMTAARVTKEEDKADTICTNTQQNIIVVSTPDERRATLYSKGVIRGIAVDDTPEEIAENIVNPYNPLAVEAHRIGNTTTVIVLFAGQKVLNYVKYGSILVRCGLYRKHFDVCKQCGKVGHRRDVFPNPITRVCFGCGIANPSVGHERECKTKCRLCVGSTQRARGNAKASTRCLELFSLFQKRGTYTVDMMTVTFIRTKREEDQVKRATWADAVKVNMAEKRQPPAQNAAKRIQEMNGVVKALGDENEKLKRRIAEQDATIQEINEKLTALIAKQQQLQQQQLPKPTQERKQEEMTEDEPEVEADPRTTKAAGPAPKRRAIEGAKERMIAERIEKQDDKLDHLEATSKVTNERLTALEQTVQQMTTNVQSTIQNMIAQMQAQLQAHIQAQMQSMEAQIIAKLQQSWTGQHVQQQPHCQPSERNKIDATIRKTLGLLGSTSTENFMALGVHNTLDEIAEAQRTAQLERLTEMRTGRQILRDLGLEPREGKQQTNVPIPDSINKKLRVCPIPRNVNPEHNKERRLARARALVDLHAREEGAVYVDAAEYRGIELRRIRGGGRRGIDGVRTREAHRAKEVAIALAVSDPGCTTVLCDSRTAVKNSAKGRVCIEAARILRKAEDIGRKKTVVIKWFPAHMGSDVSERVNANHNETANAAARGLTNRAAANTADSECWSWNSAKDRMTSFNEIVKWYRMNRQTMQPPQKGLTRMEAVLNRQLQTGSLLTSVLAKHVCPSVYASDACRLCAKERATAAHILWDCSVNPQEASEKTTIPPQLEVATRSYDQETQLKAVQQVSAALERQRPSETKEKGAAPPGRGRRPSRGSSEEARPRGAQRTRLT